MASSVFYRFKSNKDTTRITFDGTGISVFELKKAIIETSNLGDGTDFELILVSVDEKEEYSDDTEIIPRSTTVIARRRPAERPGRGGAARYVSGKAPTSAKNAQRTENMSGRSDAAPNTSAAAASAISELQTERQREEAVLRLGAEQWKQTQKEMASATRVPTTYHKPNTAASNNPPPEWYLCNRCQVKGHWIKDCPQNGNPDFDDNRRIKKAIGIPRSRLVMIDKATIAGDDGNVDVSKLPAGAMIDGDGNYVLVKADKATWNKFQEKVNKSAAAQEEEVRGSKELQDRGLECQIDKRLFVEPVKTPCCDTTYCNECITNALLDDDLRCPNCGKDGVLIDDLKADTDMIARVKVYQDEKANAKKSQEDADAEANGVNQGTTPQRPKSESPEIKLEQALSEKALSSTGSRPVSPTESNSKKRKANDELANNRASPMPSAVNSIETQPEIKKEPPKGPKAMMNQGQNNMNGNMMNMNGFVPNMPVSMPGMNGMLPMMFDPMAMFNQMNAMNQMMGMNGMGGMNGMNMNMMNGMNVPTGLMNGMGNMHNNMNQQQQQQQNFNNNGRNNNFRAGPGNQPYRQFNAARPNQEDSAYFRAPVNPHRGNKRAGAARPADYREI